MTFREKINRFFEPIRYDKIVYLKSFFEGCMDGVYLISWLYYFERIGYSIQHASLEDFKFYLISYAILSFIYFVAKFFMIHWWWVKIYVSIDTFTSKKYLTRFIQWEPNLVEKIGTGRFLQIYKTGTRNWMETIHGFLSSDLALILSSVYGIIRISQFNILYGLSIILVLVSVLCITYYTDKRFTIPYRKRRVEIEAEYGRVLARVFMSKMEYLQNDEFPKEQQRIRKMLEDIEIQNHGIDNSVGGMYIALRTLSVWLRIAVYIFVGKAIFDGSSNFWIFSTYIMIVTLFETTLRTVYDSFRKLTRDGQHIEKLWSTFDSLTPIRWYDSGSHFTPHKKDIEISSISYGYNETKVFQDFSLTIEQGKKTALVGASGGGKTTLLKLIAGYLHPDKGTISVLGNILSDTALKSYYPHIGYLTQDPSVFDATIRENLMSAISSISSVSSWGTKDLPEGENEWADSSQARNDKNERWASWGNQEERLLKALRLAHCDFVFEMEQWLDTEIGERWVRLSGWQKQRLAIAKIFLKNPDIILLDEPTSALDSFSEEAITQALNTLFQWRTVIIIAHRLQTVRHADDIVVIEGGEVVERWDHDSLSTTGWIYARMLELQSGF